MKENDNSLKKIITSNLYARYSGLLSLTDIPLFLIDADGGILLDLIPSPDFCSHICMKDKYEVCDDYKHHIKSKKQGRFICRFGLENILLPINVENKTLGYIAGMQVYSQDTEYKKYMIDTKYLTVDKDLDLEFVAKSIAGLKTIELNKIKTHEQLCRHIAKNISLDLLEDDNHLDPNIERLSMEKEILEKQIIDLEAKNMSLVVNPHFLFNTLNSIARIAYFEHSHKTEELIYCLSDLLRYNLKQDDKIHTIGSEIDNIEKYLYIQKARFNTRLEYTIDVSDQIKSYTLPNMVIQPIVENALIHGIIPKRDGGKLDIYAERHKKSIIISVADNGTGFPKEVLEKMEQSHNKSGLGFRSTDTRLKQYYGESYGLAIAKSDYSGSTVTITIPI